MSNPPLRIEQWHGGITDDYVDAPPHFARRLHEVLLNKLRKPIQRPGTAIFNVFAPQIPPGNQKIDSCYFFDSTLFVKSGTKLYLLKTGDTAWTTLSTVAAKDAFADSELGAKASWSEWRGHLFCTPHPGSTKKAGCRTIKIYRSAATTWACVRAGMPRVEDGSYSGIAISSSGNDNFVGYDVFYRTYTAVVDGNTVTFEDYGKPEFTHWQYEERADVSNGTLNWTNGTLDSYDDSNIKVRVFRTKNNDVTPLYSSEYAQGVALFYSVDDDDLGAAAYFAGGAQFWDPIPLCYYSAIVEGFGFYAAGVDVDSGSFFNTRIWQSVGGNPNAVPAANYTDVPHKITGLSYVGVYPIVFCRRSAYRVEGRIDRFGGGSLKAKEISGTLGCISADAIIRTEQGIFFPSESGWCFTDGFRVRLLSEHLTAAYAGLSSKSNMAGCFDSKNGRVYWACEDRMLNATGTNGQNHTQYVLDVNHADGDRGCFTTHGRGDYLSAYCMHYDSANDRIIMGGYQGFVFRYDSTEVSDLVMEVGSSFASWARHGIVWKVTTPAFSFGSSLVTKLMQRLQIIAKNLSGRFSVDLYSTKDDEDTQYAMKEIRDIKATTSGLHTVWRRFKKGGLRSKHRQIHLEKGFVNLFRSDDYALVTVNSSLKTVLLATGDWPLDDYLDLRHHVIAFESDGYVAEYSISDHSGDTLTLATAPAGDPAGVKWVIRGYPKIESLELRAIEIEYDLEEMTTRAYQTGGDGGNDE